MCDEEELGPFLIDSTGGRDRQERREGGYHTQRSGRRRRTNKQFLTFWRNRESEGKVARSEGSNGEDQELFLDEKQMNVMNQARVAVTEEDFVRAGRNRSCYPQTLDHHRISKRENRNHLNTYQLPQSYTCYRPVGTGAREKRLMPNPDDILPQQAWTDTSGSDYWPELENKNNPLPSRSNGNNLPKTRSNRNRHGRTRLDRNNPLQNRPSPVCDVSEREVVHPDIVPHSPSVCSPSDVTMSATSSETYPECQFQSSSCSSEQTSR